MLLVLAAHPLSVAAVGPGLDCITEPEPVSRDVADLVGDRDSFGYCDAGLGCGSFSWFEPVDDAGNFDRSFTATSSCDVTGSWTHTFTPPPGGVGSFTLRIPTVNSDSCGRCNLPPCAGEQDEKLFVDEQEQLDFLLDAPACGIMKIYSHTFGGDEANSLAGDGAIDVRWEQGGDELALDYSEIIDLRGVVTISVVSGGGQRGVIGSPVDEPLVVQLATLDPKIDLEGFNVSFRVSSQPRADSGAVLGGPPDPLEVNVEADALGRASAGVRLGVDAGDYTIKVRTANTLGDGVSFTVMAEKPGEVRIQRGTGEATAAPVASEVVYFSEEPEYFAVGYDNGGVRIGAATCNWSITAHGPASSQGAATLAPESQCESTVFAPTKQGRLTLNADLSAGPGGGGLDIVIPGFYLDIDGDFDPLNPTSDLAEFVPGSLLNGDPVMLTPTQPQVASLHFLTKPGQGGFIPLSLSAVSHWVGIAMNYPPEGTGSSEADLSFANGTDSIVVPIDASGHSVTPLLVKDYAAGGVLVVTLPGRGPHVVVLERSIPIDEPAGVGSVGNRLPDGGWQALTGEVGGVRQYLPVAEAGLLPADDVDDDPLGTGAPEAGRIGDGLTTLEEYRGFIVRGVHRRLHPERKDVFFFANDQAGEYVDSLHLLPVVRHRVWEEEFGGETSRVVNWNRVGMTGALPQKGVSLIGTDLLPLCAEPPHDVVDGYNGFTFLDTDTLGFIECSSSGTEEESPNTTRRVELYSHRAATYRVSYGHNGLAESSVPTCGGQPCDLRDDATQEYEPGLNGWQLTLGGDDFFTDWVYDCTSLVPPYGGHFYVEPAQRHTYVGRYLAHEFGHAIDAAHLGGEAPNPGPNPDCRSLMGWYTYQPLEDIYLFQESSDQIRIHRNP